MSRLPLLCCVVAWSGCSDGAIRSAAVPDQADFLPLVKDTAVARTDSETPRVVFRCEQGRLGAYLVVATAQEVDSGLADDRLIPVRLDSAPPC